MKVLNNPTITEISGFFTRQGIKFPGYRLIWQMDYADKAYFAKWWCAWFLWALLDFSYYFDVRSIEMRLDAPEWIRAHEAEVVYLPLHGRVMDFVLNHSEPLQVMKEKVQ